MSAQRQENSSPPQLTLRQQLMRGGVGSIAIKVLGTGIAFLLAVVLARILGPEGYGVYAFVFALLTLLAIPAQAGLPHLVVRETAKAHSDEDWALLRGVWGWATGFIVFFSGTVVVAIAAAVWLGGDWLEVGRRNTLVAGALLVPTLALVMVRGAALRGLGRVVLGQIPDSILRPGLLVIFVLLVAWLWDGDSLAAHHAMGLHVVAAVLAFLVAAWLLHRFRPDGVRSVTHSRREPSAWRRAAWPLALVTGLQLINTQADLLLLGVIRTDAEVGVYRVVVQMGSLVIFGLVAINQVLHPHFARLHAQGDYDRLQRLVTISARIILALASVPVLIFVFAGEPLLAGIFGSEYAVGALALAILALGQLANAAFGSVGALLNMTGHERDTMRGMALAVIVNIVLNLVLIPPYGMVGAATATAVSFVVWNAVLRHYVWLRLGMESSGLTSPRRVGTRSAP